MYPPHHLGGYELACRDAVARWISHGHHVEVLTTSLRFPHARGPDELGVRRKLELYWKDGLVVSPSLTKRIRLERHNQRVLDQTLDEVSPEVVSFWHMGAMSLSLLTKVQRRGTPAVLVVYDDWLVYGPQIDAWTRIYRNRPWAAGPAELITGVPTHASPEGQAWAACFMSGWIRHRAESKSPLQLPERRALVYGGVDHGVFRPADRSGDFGWRLLCAGRVEQRKGVHVAVEALAHLPDHTTLVVLGSWDDQAYVDSLRARADELGVGHRLELRGQVDRRELAEALGRADAFLFPVVWEEPFGMAPLEAMACGTPVVGTGTGGSDEFLIDGVNCLRFATGDPRQLAQCVVRLAGDQMLRSRLVEEGRFTARFFALDRYLDELESWHEAASKSFTEGEPPARMSLREALEQRGVRPQDQTPGA